MPNAWIKGTRNGNTVTFERNQYLGLLANKPVYMTAVNRMNTSEIQDLVFTYDEATGTFSNSTQFLLLNSSKSTVYLMQAISDFTLTKSKSGEAYDVPYSESFGSSTSMNDFTIIDGNGDGTTWVYNRMSGNVSYNWSVTNAADEWLITPAIRLEAGKYYKFTVKARSFTASMPERMEVKMGAEPTVEGMTTAVIAPTVVATGDLTPFEGRVRANTEGNFYFGIHAISDADNMMLTIDDITVDIDTSVVIGDIDGDGKVDVSDVNAVINMILKVTETDLAADLNGDNKVDVSDVNELINMILNH